MHIIRKLKTAWTIFRKGGCERLWWRYRQGLWWRKYKALGIDLDHVSRKELGLAEECVEHSATPGPELEKVLKTLNISSSDSIIDIGCGKGGALMVLASFPFAKVAGLEISQKMANTAMTNCRLLGLDQVKIHRADVCAFTELDDFNHVYLYNPFLGQVFEQFMQNMNESLARNPRTMTIIYRNPECHEMVARGGFEKVRTFAYGPHPWFIYRNRSFAGCLNNKLSR